MGNNDWKKRLGVVYSTNEDFDYDKGEENAETLLPEEQKLIVALDKRHRKGKIVTLIDGFIGTQEDLKALAKLLKVKCGVGGGAKDGQIIIQGNFKEKIKGILEKDGYSVKLK